MEYILEDPSTHVVTAFVEGFKDVKHFIRVADSALEKGKPLCILKVGRSKLGERAAASHTGSITGSDDAYETLFRQKGIIRVIDTDELLETAKACSVTKWPKSDHLAIITSSGGTGSLSADLCADHHLNLADMSPETLKELMKLEELLTFETLSNPIDIRGQGMRNLDKVLPIVLKDDHYGMALITICFSAVGKVANNVATLVRDAILATSIDKPVFVLWVGRRQRLGGTYDIEEGFEILERAGIPVFSEPQKCFKAIGKIVAFARAREKYFADKRRKVTSQPLRNKPIKDVISPGEKVITEYDSKRILSLYDMPVTKEQLASSPEEALEIAQKLGYPVALKVMSPQILHKTEANIYQLNIANPSQLLEAYAMLQTNAYHYNPKADIQGMLIQEMVPSGVEVILGMKRDPQFGPLIMFGLGGIFVEIFKDISFGFPPISEEDAHEMIKKIKGYKILQGARGKKGCDIPTLIDTITKFSHLCVDTSEIIKEIDINPLIVGEVGSGVKVVDALIVLK
jgi:acyl-CoA synthetase (NDP forming)